VEVTARAFAKVNLVLEVLGKRPDGYHEVATVLQTISVHDEVRARLADDLALGACGDIPPRDNLVLRAAEALRAATGSRQGAHLSCAKDIPVAAGLGGGSSDAAATLRALDALWGLKTPREQLLAVAAGLGSDVPFFLWGGAALARGRGEWIDPLPDPPPLWLVLLVPDLAVPSKTRTMYGLLGPGDYSDGSRALRLGERLRRGSLPQPEHLFNAFEGPALRQFPALRAAHAALRALAGHAWLAGAGPALFALFERRSAARACFRRLAERGYRTLLARTVGREESLGLSVAPSTGKGG